MSSRRPLEGLIEAPSGTIDTTRYKISTGGKTMILTVFETESSFTLYLGGYKIYCIDALVRKNKNGVFFKEGLLNKVRYDSSCVTEGVFEEGKDTSMALKCMMTYIKNTYPPVTKIQFSDLSTKVCNNGASVSLSAMKLFTDGKTWYEDHFGAKIEPEFESAYMAVMKKANNKKTEITWEEFYDNYVPTTGLPTTMDKLKSFFEESNTWQEFFSKVRNDIGIAALCIWFSTDSWYEKMFLPYVGFNLIRFAFILIPSNFSQEYTIEPFTGGWRGVTRKAKRQKVTNRRHLQCKK